MPFPVSRNKLIAGAVVVGVILAIILLLNRATPVPTPDVSKNSSEISTSPPLLATLPDQIRQVTPCLPNFGFCPSETECPASGVCCPAGALGCPSLPPPPTPVFCSTPGAKICPNGEVCLPTHLCPMDKKFEIVCVPGTTCADTSVCPASGLCPGPGRWCVVGRGICPDGTECPNSGVC